MKCLYCQQEKESTEYSLEHIFPQALGGSLFPETFKTRRVCKRCNSTLGLFVDRPFIKNFFSQSDSADAYLQYINFDEPVAMPLRYTGVLEDFSGQDNKICEVWHGPHGGIVYHVRPRSDRRYDTMIGGNPIDRRKNNGWIVIFAQNSDVYWNTVLLLSCKQYFSKARRISGGIHLRPEEKHRKYFNEPTEEELKSVEFFKNKSGKPHHTLIQIEIGFEQRFLSKLALGVGYNLIGDDFLMTTYSQKLRNAMWEKNLKKRSRIIKFSNYFNDFLNDSINLLKWQGVHSIIILPLDNILFLIFSCFGYKLMMLPICDEREIWKNSVSEEGLIYLAAPQLKISSEPLSIPEFISYKFGDSRISRLEAIEEQKFDISQLPKVTDYPRNTTIHISLDL